MMEILEKLPGITIERYTVMERSYTFAGFEAFQSRRNAGRLALSKDSTDRKDKKGSLPRRNSASDREKVTQNERMPVDVNKTVSKEFFVKNPSFQHEPRSRSRRGSKIELQVLGKNLGGLSTSSVNMLNEEEKTLPKEDVFSPDQAPLKSILKRPGSGLSIKSCHSLGVMSLDSGMTRLAASLLSHKPRKTGKHEEKHKKSQHLLHRNQAVLHREDSKNPELSTLPLLGSQSNYDLQTISKTAANIDEDSRVITLSPSKSVSFKLDPEIKETEGLLLKTKKGDARWGVALSSHQEQTKTEHSKVTEKLKFQNSRTKPPRVIVSTGHGNHIKKDVEITKACKTSETANKKPGFVHSHGTSSLTQIHRLSDPYRKYLITRATEPAQRYPQEYDVGNPDQIKHKMLNREASEAAAILRKAKRTFAKQASLDKQYMSMPYTMFKHSSALPMLSSFEK